MKEKIVLDFGAELKNICNGCAEGVKAKCKQTQKDHLQCALQMSELEEFEVEKYPKSWEELKELCKSIKGNKKDCGGAMWFEFGCLNNDKMYLGKFLCVDEKGQVGIAERSWGGEISITIFAQNRTPQQMWQIIKNLIGEE